MNAKRRRWFMQCYNEYWRLFDAFHALTSSASQNPGLCRMVARSLKERGKRAKTRLLFAQHPYQQRRLRLAPKDPE